MRWCSVGATMQSVSAKKLPRTTSRCLRSLRASFIPSSAYAASVKRLTRFAAERLSVSDRSAAMSLLYYYSWAKASRSLFSCSSGRLVEMISKS
jgi:hypothetical protein